MPKPVNPSLEPKQRVLREEWDFTGVAEDELKACCYYEYARESAYIMENLNYPRPYWCTDSRLEQLRQSPLTFALPMMRSGTVVFDRPWLLTDPKWRKQFSQQLEEHWDRLSYARSLDKTPDRAFHEGMAPHFPHERWSEAEVRLLDPQTGIETLLVTIDWTNFDDGEIASEFTRWIRKNRPEGVGLHSSKGKKTNVWRMHLMKLCILRLRHNYPLDEISHFFDEEALRNRFCDECEVNRVCRAASESLRKLFPFLPKETLPRSQQRYGRNP